MSSATAETQYDYDYIVIGGGSGGLASAKEAAKNGARVALFDYVKPSTQGTTWGLGGTCVNVGCVPKKLMHRAGILGASLGDAAAMGWQVPDRASITHDWGKLVTAVQMHVKQLNFGYRSGLMSKQVKYIRALAEFTGDHAVTYADPRSKKPNTITAKHFLVAVGGRPHVPAEVPGAQEFAITSDDIFSLGKVPGKTLCVGASYISLECAGFLKELGFDVTVAVRSILLRGFDQQCAEKIGELMAQIGVRFVRPSVPTKIEKDQATGRLHVTLRHQETGEETTEVYDTVLYATGRSPDVSGLALDKVGVSLGDKGKVQVDDKDRSTVDYVHAVGDCATNGVELTPAAIQAGELLARRLFAGTDEEMDYTRIATTVFTPAEYGCVGYSEESAEAKWGKDALETYLFQWDTLEIQAAHRQTHRVDGAPDDTFGPTCLGKLVCLKSEEERVVGFHFVGPNAGEVTQGFALAVRLGAKKKDFDELVGIHPTDAEAFTSMETTRRSGEDFTASGGCGGGKCG